MKNIKVRSVVFLSLFAVISCLSSVALAENNYPSKPITLVSAWSAGGATDLVARAIQPGLSEALGVPVVVKNVPGASGTIGTAQVARAKPDGYTILISPAGSFAIQPILRRLPYTTTSFNAVGRIAIVPIAMMTAKDSGITSVKDLVAKAKAEPGSVRIGSLGMGSTPDIAFQIFAKTAGIDLKKVPFKGAAEAVRALLGGFIDVYQDQAQLISGYDLTALALWSKTESSEYPNVPTMEELGYDFHFSNWQGLFVPKGVAKDRIEILSKALEAALKDPEIKESLQKLKLTIAWQPPEKFEKYVNSYSVKMKNALNE